MKKSILTLLFVVILSCGLIVATGFICAAASNESRIAGDIDENGTLDILDVSALLNLLAGETTDTIYDINGDGIVNISDVTDLLNKLSVRTPVAEGTCGENLTWALYENAENADYYDLVITGSGAMTDYSAEAPWYSYSAKIKNISLPDRLTKIGGYAFFDCTSLQGTIIPDSVTSIGEGAFSGCYALQSIIIPDSVTSIGSYAFYYCIKLTSITFTGTIEEWNAISKGYA